MAETNGDRPKVIRIDQRSLRGAIVDRYNLEDLRTLCADLRIDYDDLPAMGRKNKVRELIAFCERTGRTKDLLALCQRDRPDFDWSSVILAEGQKAVSQGPEARPRSTWLVLALLFSSIFFIVACALLLLITRPWEGSSPSESPVAAGTSAVEMVDTLAATEVEEFPTARPTETVTPQPTSTATPEPATGLITFRTEDEGGKTLYALIPGGTPVALFPEAAVVKIVAISPERDYMAIAISQEGSLEIDDLNKHFLGGIDVSLVVVSADGRRSITVVEGVSLFDADYTPDGLLIMSVMEENVVTYYVAQTDGSGLRELYRSVNEFATPEPTGTPGEEPVDESS